MDVIDDRPRSGEDLFRKYCRETDRIKKKLGKNVSSGKKAKLEYQLRDLESRLIPGVCRKLQI